MAKPVRRVGSAASKKRAANVGANRHASEVGSTDAPSRTTVTADPWAPKGVSINLSRARREALRSFADSADDTGCAMTPAQALYSLIDLIDGANADNLGGHANDDAETRSQISVDADEERNRFGARANATETGSRGDQFHTAQMVAEDARFDRRLSAIEREMATLSEAMAQCASALEQVGAAMAPIHALLSRLNVEAGRERPETAGVAPIALPLAEWVRQVSPAAQDGKDIVAALRLSGKQAAASGETRLSFACRLPSAGAIPQVEAPGLALIDKIGGPLALCLELEPGAGLVAVIARGAGDVWEARICRRSASGALGPVIYRARASAAARAS